MAHLASPAGSLASGGDDYALVCAVAPDKVGSFVRAVQALGVSTSIAGMFTPGPGLRVMCDCRDLEVASFGWRH